jgi:hypothetical protein
MSLFQCEHCGCCENTALGRYWGAGVHDEFFDWVGIEGREGKKLCSACGPSAYRGGEPTRFGKWHGQFDRVFLPKGQFKTNQRSNLEHIATGDEDFRKFALSCEN